MEGKATAFTFLAKLIEMKHRQTGQCLVDAVHSTGPAGNVLLQCNTFAVDETRKSDVERRLQLMLLDSQNFLHVIVVSSRLTRQPTP